MHRFIGPLLLVALSAALAIGLPARAAPPTAPAAAYTPPPGTPAPTAPEAANATPDADSAGTMPTDEDVPTAPVVLEPFSAQYRVLRAGRDLGRATMRLTRLDGGRWQVDLVMRGEGLIGLAGLQAEQSTVFEEHADHYRPLSQATVRKTLFTRRRTVGTYDWSRLTAQWQGDIKKTRRAPVSLREGDMSGLLINLAVIRDARPGQRLSYRFVDGGRVRDHHYAVAPELESVEVADMRYNAMRVSRAPDTAGEPPPPEETVIWVVSGVPTPVRMLQRENGEDAYDLRLIEYTGVP